MASFAHGEFVGNMVADPDYKTVGKKDSPMLAGRMAVNLSKKNSEGEWENVPLWVAFAYFGANAENLAEKISKGDTVLVAGRIEPETYKKDGVEVRGFKVMATTVQLLTSKVAKRDDDEEDEEEEEEERPRMKSRF